MVNINDKPAHQLNDHGQPIGYLVKNWIPRQKPPKTVMTGRAVRLEPLSPEHHTNDLWEVYSNCGDDRDWTYLPETFPKDLFEFQKLISRMASDPELVMHAVVNATTGKALGMVCFKKIDQNNGTVELGFVNLSPKLKRSLHSTEAIFLMACRAFDELGYRRLEWNCDALNEASKSAAVRYGFQFEGRFRNDVIFKGHSVDIAYFSIIESEWPTIRSTFESWLDPANFDSEGGQLSRLSEMMMNTRLSLNTAKIKQ